MVFYVRFDWNAVNAPQTKYQQQQQNMTKKKIKIKTKIDQAENWRFAGIVFVLLHLVFFETTKNLKVLWI